MSDWGTNTSVTFIDFLLTSKFVDASDSDTKPAPSAPSKAVPAKPPAPVKKTKWEGEDEDDNDVAVRPPHLALKPARR